MVLIQQQTNLFTIRVVQSETDVQIVRHYVRAVKRDRKPADNHKLDLRLNQQLEDFKKLLRDFGHDVLALVYLVAPPGLLYEKQTGGSLFGFFQPLPGRQFEVFADAT